MSESPTESIHVVGLCGSIREDSFTRRALKLALQGAQEMGATVDLVDLRTYDLPFCSGKDNQTDYPRDVFRLREDVSKAHGLIVATPEYHGSYAGVLKNAIDLMGFDQFEGKMLGLVGVSGGALGAVDALNSLRNIGRALHAWVVPHQASVAEAYKHFGDDGSLTNDALKERVLDVGRQVARFAFLHSSQQSQSFMNEWEKALPNPGGGRSN